MTRKLKIDLKVWRYKDGFNTVDLPDLGLEMDESEWVLMNETRLLSLVRRHRPDATRFRTVRIQPAHTDH